MPRATTIIALVQTLCVILGLVGLNSALKLEGYPQTAGFYWNPLPVFLREHGTWLILTPLVWLTYACVAQKIDKGFWSYKIACVVGICLCCGTLWVFGYASTNMFTRMIFGHYH
jgi:hypothetical protein